MIKHLLKDWGLASAIALLLCTFNVVAAPTENIAAQAFISAPENHVTVIKRADGFASLLSTDRTRPLPFVSLSVSTEARARDFLFANRGLFLDATSALELVTIRIEENDPVGINFVRVQQTLSGIPIYGAEAIVHLSDAGITAVSSKLAPALAGFNITPVIGSAAALQTAQQLVVSQYGPVAATFTVPKLEILDPGVFSGTTTSLQLTWYIEANGDALRERIWVNAWTGVVAFNFSQLTDARNRNTFNANNTSTIPATPARTEAQAAVGNIHVDNAHDFAADVYDYFFKEHARDSFSGTGSAMNSIALYCSPGQICPYKNAFWNGIRIYLGQGYAIDDVVAHEWSHGVIDYTGNMDYVTASGALNESYADIFGETIDLGNGKGKDTPAVRWMIGEDLFATGIRNMSNPAIFKDPPRITDSLYFCLPAGTAPAQGNDWGGVHTNSGVSNHAYALMVDGGSYNGYTITSIGVSKAAKIQYRALTRLTRTSQYLDNANALILACSDLIGGPSGITHDDCAQVKKAVLAVEMTTLPCPKGAVPPALPLAVPTPLAVVPAQCSTGQIKQDLLNDNFENPTSGNWVTASSVGANHWTGGSGVPAIYFAGKGVGGSTSLQATAAASAADSNVQMSNDVTLPANAILQFETNYDFDAGFDGGVVEYSLDSGVTWRDAAPLMTVLRNYDGGIANGMNNPLGGRAAFTGHTTGYVSSQINLASLAGNKLRVRFRMGTDRSIASPGWAIDNVAIYSCIRPVVGVTVTPTINLRTTEVGGTATFSVVLNGQPTANVVIGLSSSKVSEGTVAPSALTFTSANWNVPQPITVTGVDDAIDDGDVTYSIITANAQSADAAYNNYAVIDVDIINVDNDVIEIRATPVSGLITTEAGGNTNFKLVLGSQPLSDVTLQLTGPSNEVKLSPASVTFTALNWNQQQTVFVAGVDDSIVDGDQPFEISMTVVSADAKYTAATRPIIRGVNRDNDAAGISVSPLAGLTTSELGAKATFAVQLNTAPSANVSITLSSSDLSEGTVTPTTLVFNATNWNVPQSVTVTGVDDQATDGNINYSIISAPAVSLDTKYSGVNPDDVAVTNIDNDAANILISTPDPLVTSESGSSVKFSVKLSTAPIGNVNVTLGLSVSNSNEGKVDRSSLTFNGSTWDTPQIVTVTGVDDPIPDGDIDFTLITTPLISADTAYDKLNPPDLKFTNLDNDVPGLLVNTNTTLQTTEVGTRTRFAVALTVQPRANVTISLSSSNAAEGQVTPATLEFTPANWNLLQSGIVTGVDDTEIDGTKNYEVILDAAASVDLDYSAVKVRRLAAQNLDNETASPTLNADLSLITVSTRSGLMTTEGGGQATFTIKLTQPPIYPVVIPLHSSNTAEGRVEPTSLTFDPSNWEIPQTVTIIGNDDKTVDGDVAYKIHINVPRSTDTYFTTGPGVARSEVQVTNSDNDKVSSGAWDIWFLLFCVSCGIIGRCKGGRVLLRRN